MGFPRGSVVKNLPTNSRDTDSIPGSGRFPGEGNGNPLQYSCLENPMDRGAWWSTVHGVAKSPWGHKSKLFRLPGWVWSLGYPGLIYLSMSLSISFWRETGSCALGIAFCLDSSGTRRTFSLTNSWIGCCLAYTLASLIVNSRLSIDSKSKN